MFTNVLFHSIQRKMFTSGGTQSNTIVMRNNDNDKEPQVDNKSIWQRERKK